MLKTIEVKSLSAPDCRFAIIASRYNARYVNSMVRSAKQVLAAAEAATVEVYRVPGAFEIPVVASCLCEEEEVAPDAVICLGVILRGETLHADHIGQGVTQALIRIQTATRIPMIHEVLLLEDEAQARARCLDKENNRGREAAQTAVEMAMLMRKIEASQGKRLKAFYLANTEDDCPF